MDSRIQFGVLPAWSAATHIVSRRRKDAPIRRPPEFHAPPARSLFVTDVHVQVSLLSMGTPLPVELDILGWSDSLILMVLALVVFGPRRLPQIGRQIGKLMYEFRKASNEFKFQMEEELRAAEEADRRKKEEERLKALALKAPAAETPAAEPPAAL
ncbi:MAG: twin-arginine translocase TatA/TatE family subunit, partial [Terracidiphilus sp.]